MKKNIKENNLTDNQIFDLFYEIKNLPFLFSENEKITLLFLKNNCCFLNIGLKQAIFDLLKKSLINILKDYLNKENLKENIKIHHHVEANKTYLKNYEITTYFNILKDLIYKDSYFLQYLKRF